MKKRLLTLFAFMLIAYIAVSQEQMQPPVVINPNDMEHQMRTDQQAQRVQSYEAFAGRASGAQGSFNATGAALAKEGKYYEALKQFDEAIHANTTYADAYYNRGLVKLKLHRLKDALADFNTAVGLNPTDVMYIESQADAKLSAGDLNGAIDGCGILINISRTPAKAYLKRGQIEFELKSNDAALADLTKAKQLGSLGADSLMNVIAPGSADKVVVSFSKKAIDTAKAAPAPEPYIVYYAPKSTNHDAMRYDSIALHFAHAGNMPEAIRNFTRSIAADPAYASAYNNRGFAELIQHEYRDAVKDYIKAIALDPKAVNAYSNCANAMYEMKDYGGALKYFDLSLNLDPTNVVNYGNRGVVKRLTHDYEGAISDFDKCLQLSPQYTQALVNKALTEFDLNKKDEGCTDLTKARNMGSSAAAQYIMQYCH